MRSIARHILLCALSLSALPVTLVGRGYAAEEDCPCGASTFVGDTCSCPVQITTYSGFPANGECDFDGQECGRDLDPCQWKGQLRVLCAGQTPVVKLFDLATDCGAMPTVRQINCTGGSGSISLRLQCETCP